MIRKYKIYIIMGITVLLLFMVTSIVIILDKNIDINNKIKFKSEIISEFEEMIDGKSKIRRYSCINKW